MAEAFDAPTPEIRQWWTEHLKDPALVVIKCALGDPRCGRRVGEIKRDGNTTMALRKMIRPEPTVPNPRGNWTAQTVTELEQRASERDRHVLRRFDSEQGPMEVMKQRRDLPSAVAPLTLWSSYCCPVHGDLPVNQDALAQFVASVDDTQSVTERTYRLPD